MKAKKSVRVKSRHGDLTKRIAQLVKRGGGTLDLVDGVYPIDKTLRLPREVSLRMGPHAIIRALPNFEGEVVVLKEGVATQVHEPGGWICGGVIDGGKQALTGLQVKQASRMTIADLEVRDALFKGIHVGPSAKGPGASTTCEVNMSRVRMNVDLKTPYAPQSIGLHYEEGDNLVNAVVVIGYETGVRSDSASNDFQLVHVWNAQQTQGPMKYCFHCNGHGDTYTQCYADSPTVAGFYMTRMFNRVAFSKIYYSRWAPDNTGTGIFIEPSATHCTFVGNYFQADMGHTLAKAYDGFLDTACIVGEGYNGWVIQGGREARIPAGGGDHPLPPLLLGGPQLIALKEKPKAEQGLLGEVRWVDGGAGAGLYVKTSEGWLRAKLEK